MTYVDGLVLAVAKADKGAYRALSAKASEVFRKHDALRHIESRADYVP